MAITSYHLTMILKALNTVTISRDITQCKRVLNREITPLYHHSSILVLTVTLIALNKPLAMCGEHQTPAIM